MRELGEDYWEYYDKACFLTVAKRDTKMRINSKNIDFYCFNHSQEIDNIGKIWAALSKIVILYQKNQSLSTTGALYHFAKLLN